MHPILSFRLVNGETQSAQLRLDIVATVTKSNFIDRVLFPYIRSNIDVYLSNNWHKPVLQRDVKRLAEQSNSDGGPKVDPMVRKSVADYVVRCQDEVRDNEAIRIFR